MLTQTVLVIARIDQTSITDTKKKPCKETSQIETAKKACDATLTAVQGGHFEYLFSFPGLYFDECLAICGGLGGDTANDEKLEGISHGRSSSRES